MIAIIILGTLIFINMLILASIIIIGGITMVTIQSAIQTLNAAITALQARLSAGVVVQQSDLDSAAAAINAASTTIGTIAP